MVVFYFNDLIQVWISTNQSFISFSIPFQVRNNIYVIFKKYIETLPTRY